MKNYIFLMSCASPCNGHSNIAFFFVSSFTKKEFLWSLKKGFVFPFHFWTNFHFCGFAVINYQRDGVTWKIFRFN